MTEYEDAYMELRGCTFEVKLPKESIDAIIQSMMDKTTLVCSTRAPKKCCGNCKYAIYRGVYEQYGENIGFCYCDWKEKMINPLLSTPYDPMDGDNCEYWVSYDCKESD